ncbi:tRNA (adenosine(37)-N6)-threonylcarbamoyltransferase complex dimerization subunit type 1 TsaB [candidate division GN15 bacterium]|nr:tRNA (adenosine(37)-N6)-threonylcarbamoyltransferase complex dimerization subunit type 1 TsaB [candidate division GN15 bacterium]
MSNDTMNILAIDTATSYLQLAMAYGGDRMVNSSNDVGRLQGQVILKKIEELFESTELRPADLDVIVVCIGPGSFTGLRVGIAAAKSIAEVVDAHVVGVTMFDMIAERLPDREEVVWAMVPSRRDEVYLARIKSGQVEGDSIDVYADQKVADTVANDLMYAISIDVPGRFPGIKTEADGGLIHPTAADLLRVGTRRALAGQFDDLVLLEPLYLQKAIAEIRFDERQRRSAD